VNRRRTDNAIVKRQRTKKDKHYTEN